MSRAKALGAGLAILLAIIVPVVASAAEGMHTTYIGARYGPGGADYAGSDIWSAPSGYPAWDQGTAYWSEWYTAPGEGVDSSKEIDHIWFRAQGTPGNDLVAVERYDSDGSSIAWVPVPSSGQEEELELNVLNWGRIRVVGMQRPGTNGNGYVYLDRVKLMNQDVIYFPRPPWAGGGTGGSPWDPDVDPPAPPNIPTPVVPTPPTVPTYPTIPTPPPVTPPQQWPDPGQDWEAPVPDLPVDDVPEITDPVPTPDDPPIADPVPDVDDPPAADPIPTPDDLTPADPVPVPDEIQAADPLPTPDDVPEEDPIPDVDDVPMADPLPDVDDPPMADPVPMPDNLPTVDDLPIPDDPPTLDPLPEADPITEPDPLPGTGGE